MGHERAKRRLVGRCVFADGVSSTQAFMPPPWPSSNNEQGESASEEEVPEESVPFWIDP